MPDVQMQDVVGGGRICFRGDDRAPSVMFNQGFYSRKPNSNIKYNDPNLAPMFIHEEHGKIYEQQGFGLTKGKSLATGGASIVDTYRHAVLQGPAPKGQPIALVPRTPDIDLLTSVCITPRFSMAVLFPPKERARDIKEFTWVYAVYVRQLYNTHAQQVCDGLLAIKNELAVRDKISSSPGTSLMAARPCSVPMWKTLRSGHSTPRNWPPKRLKRMISSARLRCSANGTESTSPMVVTTNC